jgi:hypothetical protein
MPTLPPLDPKKPRTSPSRRPASKGVISGSKASPRVPQGPPPIPSLSPAQAALINGDECRTRDEILQSELIAYTALAAWRNDEVLLGVQIQKEHFSRTLEQLSGVTQAQAVTNQELLATSNGLIARSNSLHDDLRNFIQWHSSSTSHRLKEVELEAYHLKKKVEELEEQRGKLLSENVGLRQTVSRKLLEAESHFASLRADVERRLTADQIDFASLKAGVFQRIDAAVLLYHRPQFDSAVQGLRDHLESVEKEVHAHSARLKLVAESIGGWGVVTEVKSMHSQLPESLRAEVRLFSKEQLVSLIDVLSFESGVTSAVAAAVAASRIHDTQNVF